MAPVHGSAAELYAPGYDFGAFIREATTDSKTDEHDVTTFASNGNKEFILGLREGELTAEGLWMGTPAVTTDIDPIMAGFLGDENLPWLFMPSGDTFGTPAKLINGHVTKWTCESPVKDVNKCSLAVTGSTTTGGIEPVLIHRALATAGTGTDVAGTAIDNGAASTNGGVGYVINTAYTSGALAVKIQHSTDNSVWVDLVTFTSIGAANVVERIAVAPGTTVNRYTRCIHTVTTTAKTYACSFGRK
jgi:hypothetical protein